MARDAVAYSELWFELAKNYSNGDSPEMAIDGSTPAHFDIKGTGVDDDCHLHRVCVQIVDGGITPIKFGGISALGNGLTIKLLDANDVVLFDFLDGLTVKRNSDWGLLSGVDNVAYAAPADDHFPVRWTIGGATGGWGLSMAGGKKLRFTVQDNIAALTFFRIMGQGLT